MDATFPRFAHLLVNRALGHMGIWSSYRDHLYLKLALSTVVGHPHSNGAEARTPL
jgi:hypothetical protein